MSSLASATRYTSRPVEAVTPGSAAARSLGDALAALLPPLCQQGAGGVPERSAAQDSGGEGAAAAAAAAATHQAGQVERWRRVPQQSNRQHALGHLVGGREHALAGVTAISESC